MIYGYRAGRGAAPRLDARQCVPNCMQGKFLPFFLVLIYLVSIYVGSEKSGLVIGVVGVAWVHDLSYISLKALLHIQD